MGKKKKQIEEMAKSLYDKERADVAWDRLAKKFKRAFRRDAMMRLRKIDIGDENVDIVDKLQGSYDLAMESCTSALDPFEYLLEAKREIEMLRDDKRYLVPKWEWDVFGGGLLIANLTINPPLWRRILTRVFLGSRWKKLHETSAK